MAQLLVNVSTLEGINQGIEILKVLGAEQASATHPDTMMVPQEAQPIIEKEGIEEEVVVDEGMGDLDDLMEEEEVPTGPTVEDVKLAFKNLATTKGKDVAMGVVKQVFAKLGVKKMEDVAEDKRETVINIFTKKSA